MARGARIELRRLSGATAFADLDAVDVPTLRTRVAEIEGIPAEHLRLKCGIHELNDGSDGSLLSRGAAVTILLRLEGGKGGFGAMLRTAGARGVKTTNFDACRDLNGRRLRHVNAEARLREWDAQAEERKLKKQQQDALNAKPTGPPPIARFDEEEYEEMLEGARGRVSDALAAGLAAAADGAGSSGTEPPAAEAAEAAAVDASAAAAVTAPGASAKALGKRKAAAEPAAETASAAPPKTAKLNAAFDPLAALGGGSDSESDESEAEAEAKPTTS